METEKAYAEYWKKLKAEYREFKSVHVDAILLLRNGDFYETYDDDAVIVSEVCGTTITKPSSSHNDKTTYSHLTLFAHYRIDTYLPKLIRAGHHIAIYELLDPPPTLKRPTYDPSRHLPTAAKP